ncbi:MAG: rhamnose ABC transporter substrate-binding protein [Oscillospiraceae bacterium]
MKKALAILVVLVLSLSMLAACGSTASSTPASTGSTPASTGGSTAGGDKTYVLVAKDINNPYMQKAYEGFEKACLELGVTPLYKGPDQATPEKQIEIINQLVAQGVDLIAVAANDADALQPALTAAMDKGIKVVSFDSAVNKDSRMLHINQADPEKIGRVLVQAAYEMVDGEGGIAILSATAQATNQNLWIEWMQKEIEENADKYANTPLVKIVYGDDEPTKSTNETQALLADPSIKVIIAPTTVGMLAAGTYLQNNNSDVLLTGLGLPSEMAPFIESGVCPWMYLWNPEDLGYLAAFAGNSLVDGTITGADGESFTAGTMGEMAITLDADGGTEVLMGDPFKFDKDNIAEWKVIY